MGGYRWLVELCRQDIEVAGLKKKVKELKGRIEFLEDELKRWKVRCFEKG